MKDKSSSQAHFSRVSVSRTGLRAALVTGLLVMLILVGCNLPNQGSSQSAEDLLASMVAATLQAMNPTETISTIQVSTADGSGGQVSASQTSAPQNPTVTATPSTGKVSGLVCYTQDLATNLVAYFQNTSTSVTAQLPVSVNNYQAEYSIELEPGNYTAYAWTVDFSNGGTYSACGLVAGCKDATPRQFTVTGGGKLEKIDICDWSHGPFDVPYPPGFQATAQFGVISGGIYGYPYGSLPGLRIIAFNKSSGYWYLLDTVSGQSYFSMEELPAGTYQVVAYDDGGHAGGASGLIAVTGGKTANADINDWSSSFPADPSK